ncbi:MAG: two-component system sensor histidine kinase RegB [Rickettsiales bacterium]|jgi:two-component system sensor histidine kinase RegB
MITPMKSTIYQNTNKKNLLQLIYLRLIAILGQVATILFAHYVLNISLPLTSMFLVLTILVIVNFLAFYRYKSHKNISDKSLFIELLFDVFALTAQIYFSGGISNPFISLFLLQVIIGAILLRTFYAWLIAFVTIICYVWLSFNYEELHAFHNHESGDLFNLHLHGMLVSYVFAAILLLIFITKIIKNLKEGDKQINLLKEQSLQKEQLVRMGLLATGAAHELGTPLSTILVLVGDWKEMNLNKDLLEDVNIVESQIKHCKNILSKILSSSGNIRYEEAKMIPIKDAFNGLVEEWKNSRKPQNLIYNFHGKSVKKIILGDMMSQALFNIFDNALEESPNFVLIDIEIDKYDLEIFVEDQGKGFSEHIIEEIGKPNLSTKNSSGLGLFLALNILSRIDGSLKIANLPNKGAKVVIKIPLKNL